MPEKKVKITITISPTSYHKAIETYGSGKVSSNIQRLLEEDLNCQE